MESRRALSHASDRTSTTEASLYLQGRTRDGDHAELAPFINEEKFQTERSGASEFRGIFKGSSMFFMDFRGFSRILESSKGVLKVF